MSKKCTTCGQKILSKRSVEISTRFHGWVTFLARELARNRNQVYFEALLLAVEIECDGGSPYPYSMITRKIESPISGEMIEFDVVEPWRTSMCSNKEMMTACRACELIAAEHGLILPEKDDNPTPERRPA